MIRHGHPSTLHLWWARRPLAACPGGAVRATRRRSVLLPEEFPTKAAQDAERERLHNIIRAIVPWEATRNETVLHAARYEIARSVARSLGQSLPPVEAMRPREVIDYLQVNAPPVYDPFSGSS